MTSEGDSFLLKITLLDMFLDKNCNVCITYNSCITCNSYFHMNHINIELLTIVEYSEYGRIRRGEGGGEGKGGPLWSPRGGVMRPVH